MSVAPINWRPCGSAKARALEEWIDSWIQQQQTGRLRGASLEEAVIHIATLVEEKRYQTRRVALVALDYAEYFDLPPKELSYGLAKGKGLDPSLVRVIRRTHQQENNVRKVNGSTTD